MSVRDLQAPLCFEGSLSASHVSLDYLPSFLLFQFRGEHLQIFVGNFEGFVFCLSKRDSFKMIPL